MNRIGELSSTYLLAGVKQATQADDDEKDNARMGFFSKARLEAVCEQLPEDLHDFCRFGYLTGMRFGSITKVGWADIEDGEMNLPAKTKKCRTALKLPLEGELAELIARLERTKVVESAKGTEISALVFHRAGKPVLPFGRTSIKACVAAGQGRMVCPACGQESTEPRCSHGRKPTYEGRLFRDFRRSAARDMIRVGVPQTVAMASTGQKTVSMFRGTIFPAPMTRTGP
jgi:integrase